MVAPTELSIEEIRNFIVARGGKVTNHDLVKHFKPFLTNSETKDEARETFKKYVNVLGSIKNENGEKYIVLKKKKTIVPDSNTSLDSTCEDINISNTTMPTEDTTLVETPTTDTHVLEKPTVETHVLETPIESQVVEKPVVETVVMETPAVREPPPYRPPPVITSSPKAEHFKRLDSLPLISGTTIPSMGSPITSAMSSPNLQSYIQLRRDSEPEEPPALPERRKSSTDKQDTGSDNVSISSSTGAIRKQRKVQESTADNFNTSNEESRMSTRSDSSRSLNSDSEHQVSVKERMQKFNKMTTSEVDFVRRQPLSKRKTDRGTDDDDRVSVVSLNQAGHEWIMKATAADYPALAKMANDDPKLLKVKDPATTVLHWAAKHGNEDIVKLVAGKCKSIINQRSNGGYTPLHIAKQFRHEAVFVLLTEVYGADQTMRDWSGKKARQYQVTEDTSVSAETYRRLKASRQKRAEKEMKFLRIGSLNLRVKKTTHAFSNFLGVGSGSKSSGSKTTGRMAPSSPGEFIKSWGSADNLQNKVMPPPQSTKVRRRTAKKTSEYPPPSQSRSTPSTPNQVRSILGSEDQPIPSHSSTPTQQDSDSDSACGFDAQWQYKGSKK